MVALLFCPWFSPETSTFKSQSVSPFNWYQQSIKLIAQFVQICSFDSTFEVVYFNSNQLITFSTKRKSGNKNVIVGSDLEYIGSGRVPTYRCLMCLLLCVYLDEKDHLLYYYTEHEIQ